MANTFYYRTTILIFGIVFSQESIEQIMKISRQLIIFTFILCGFIATAQRGIRIGYIDMEYILESVPEYKAAQIQLEGRVERWRKDIEKMSNEIEQMKLDLANERILLTKELIDEREEEIKIKEDELIDYQQQRFGPQGDLITQRRQLVRPIQDQVFNIIQEIGDNRNYDFIFDKSADVVMLYASERHDISDMVLRSIERAGRRVQATNRKEQRQIELEEERDNTEPTERDMEMEKRQEEREQILDARKRERDSIRDARQREYEDRRKAMLEERQRRRDSIENARKKRD